MKSNQKDYHLKRMLCYVNNRILLFFAIIIDVWGGVCVDMFYVSLTVVQNDSEISLALDLFILLFYIFFIIAFLNSS